jgi:hypothetical protein
VGVAHNREEGDMTVTARTIHLRTARRLMVVVLALVAFVTGFGVTSQVTAGLPYVRTQGNMFYAGKHRFIAYGFNYGTLRYFDRPNLNRLSAVGQDFERMRRMGVNTVRVFLELPQFMESANQPDRDALRSLTTLLRLAEDKGLYLDITGNLNWRPNRRAAWYDALPEAERWNVQARFWRAVARRGAGSPAVFAYELTSEPVVGNSQWYSGRFGGLDFVQSLTLGLNGRDGGAVARQWMEKLRGAVRSRDQRGLVTVGVMPFTTGPFGPANMAGELDFLTVHKYKGIPGTASAFASQGKPVLLGETFPLATDLATWRQELLEARTHLQGFLSHYKPARYPPTADERATVEELFRSARREFRQLRGQLLSAADTGALAKAA